MATGPVEGGGAPAVVQQIVNAKWEQSEAKISQALALSNRAVDIASPPPAMVIVEIDDSGFPAIDAPTFDVNPNDSKNLYDEVRREMDALIQGGYREFMETYFPPDNSLSAALDWINTALTTGGSGIRPAVERALIERARARLEADSMRAEGDLMQGFANRGFPLPPGMLVNGIAMLGQDKRNKLAEQSREVMIEAWRAELENMRFAVQQAIDYRLKAIAAAGDYIKTLMLGPQTAVQLATSLAGLQTEQLRAMVQLYTAQSSAIEPFVRMRIESGRLKQQSLEANLKSSENSLEIRARAAVAAAGMVGTIAGASLNGISAGASISGQDSTSM